MSITLSYRAVSRDPRWDDYNLDVALDSVADSLEFRNDRDSGHGDSEGEWFATVENWATPNGVYHVLFTGTHGNDHSPMTMGNTHATLFACDDSDDLQAFVDEVKQWEDTPEYMDD